MLHRAYRPLLSLAPEGWPLALLLAALGLYAAVAGAWAITALAAAGWLGCLWFFHDGERQTPCRPRGVLAPVDGVVVHRRECHDPVLGREAIRLTLRVRCGAAYALRSPIEGEVAALPPSERGQPISRIRTDEGEDVLLVVRRGFLGPRPLGVAYGERVGQGRRCGFRRLAWEFDLLLPAGSRVEVENGARVRAGESVLATLVRRSSEPA